MIRFKTRNIVICCFTFMVLTAVNACKKYENPPQIFEEYGDGLNGQTDRKVLIINIGGLAGADVESLKPKNISELLKTSKYNFNVITDAKTSKAATMASLLTGVSSGKHLINDDTYAPIYPEDDSHNEILKYPTLFSRMLDVRPEFKNVAVTSDPALNKYLIHADRRVLTSNDASVKDSTANILKDQNSRVVMVDFKGVDAAGTKDGYSLTVPAYKAAIETVDNYIADLITAVKGRKNYNAEDWLIILTTNRGGSIDNPKAGFIICSNPNLKAEAVTKTGFNTIRFVGVNTSAAVVDDHGLYDSGADKDFTVQTQVKFNANSSWPGFLSKGTNVSGHSTTGWVMIFNGDTWEVQIGGKNNGGTTARLGSGTVKVNDLKWHTLTLTVKTEAGVRTATIYTDGVKTNSGNITPAKTLTTTEPLKIGYRPQDNSGTNLNFFAADVLYFNVALDEATIKANMALKDITKHPKYTNLIGYWPVDDGGGAIVSNKAPVGYNMLLNGGVWESLGNEIPLSRERQDIREGSVSIVPTTPDITAITMYWLKVPVKTDWGLEGVGWISNFELEFIK